MVNLQFHNFDSFGKYLHQKYQPYQGQILKQKIIGPIVLRKAKLAQWPDRENRIQLVNIGQGVELAL